MKKRVIIIFTVFILIVLIIIGVICFFNNKTRNQISIILTNNEEIGITKVFNLKDCELYYYGIEDIIINENQYLSEILQKNNTDNVVEKIIQQAEIDAKNGYCSKQVYEFNKTKKYIYSNFTIIKCDIEATSEVIKDIYILPKNIVINDIKEIKIKVNQAGYTSYYYTGNKDNEFSKVDFEVLPIESAYNEWTIKTSGFNFNNKIICYLEKDGKRISDKFEVKGNQEIKSIPLQTSSFEPGTYTLVTTVSLYDSSKTEYTSITGNLEVFIY